MLSLGFSAAGHVAKVEFTEDKRRGFTAVAVATWRLKRLKEGWFP
jgi:hypothetical protein